MLIVLSSISLPVVRWNIDMELGASLSRMAMALPVSISISISICISGLLNRFYFYPVSSPLFYPYLEPNIPPFLFLLVSFPLPLPYLDPNANANVYLSLSPQ